MGLATHRGQCKTCWKISDDIEAGRCPGCWQTYWNRLKGNLREKHYLKTRNGRMTALKDRTHVHGRLPLPGHETASTEYKNIIKRRVVELIVALHRLRGERGVDFTKAYYIARTSHPETWIKDGYPVIVGFVNPIDFDNVHAIFPMERVEPYLMYLANAAMQMRSPAWGAGLDVGEFSSPSPNTSKPPEQDGEMPLPGQS